jgi:hypothetical protein
MLLKRQTAILDNYITTLRNDQYISYDELPRDLRDSLERIKNGETLPCDAERHISDRLVERMVAGRASCGW